MTAAIWYLIVGGLLLFMALSSTVLTRLPMSAAMIYLVAGYVLSASGAGILDLDVVRDAKLLEHLTEGAVLVSLFTAGLKLRVPMSDARWRLPVFLATLSMAMTVLMVAAFGVIVLSLPLGAAVLLGAILAPTDPVLAAEVQVREPGDTDKLRFSLTAEAGLNDGTAFPFVFLGLGLLGLHELGVGWWRWWLIDVGWAGIIGLGVGFALGTLLARAVIYLRRTHQEALERDNFLALGLIAVAYGSALLLGGYGFLAAFAAGLALRREEMQQSDIPPERTEPSEAPAQATREKEQAPERMLEAVLGFNEQIDNVLEVAVVLVVGALLVATPLTWHAAALATTLFLLIRPISVFVGLLPVRGAPVRRWFASWFGIRGIGSLYYLAHATGHGLSEELSRTLAGLVLWTIALSIFIHGVSVTPLMKRYSDWVNHRRAARSEKASYAEVSR